MAERTPDVAVWGYFLSAQKMVKLHALFRDLRLPLFNRHDMVQTSFSQFFVSVLEVVSGDDVCLFDLSVSSSLFQLMFFGLQH